jgi:hypothetical protein
MDNFGEPRDSDPEKVMVMPSRERRTVDPSYLGEKKDLKEQKTPRGMSRISKL